jgi:hypothetical protein
VIGPNWLGGGVETSESALDLLKEFDAVTADGFGGRYPFNAKKKETYLDRVESIDLLNLLCRTENRSLYFNEMLRELERENGVP